jgi:adenylate cyclase
VALGAYGEAVKLEGDGIQGLPVDEVFDRLLRSWAHFARLSPTLAGWLTSHHLNRAIDEYSVTSTEQILEETGFVAARLEAPPAVSFVDLTGFTRLTEERGDEVAAGIAMRLGEVTAEVVARRAGRVVKLLGDGVLIRFVDATTAVEATLDLLEALPQAGLPSGHAGVASGPLIMRDGDVFGRTVNTAARIADVAPDGRLYVADVLASALPPERYVLRPADRAVLQGIGPVPLVDVRRVDERMRPGSR